jgi:hypothetical protein
MTQTTPSGTTLECGSIVTTRPASAHLGLLAGSMGLAVCVTRSDQSLIWNWNAATPAAALFHDEGEPHLATVSDPHTL